ncbi:MAG: aldo/keto reductase [Candidatus Hydrogenedentes bacterium]|nr:aldo/keto reductase [Candidatus Hydrogenedentota bacterium]
MNYTYFGKTGIQVSEVCLGTMTFGKEADEKTANAIMERAVEKGINFFDTANIYCKGLTEEIVGRWLRPRRENIVLASKVHFPTGDDPNQRGSSRRHIHLEVDRSLQRLQTDWLDVLYLHHWDDHTEIEHSLDAISSLIERGKVHYCGVSNFSAWQIMKSIAVADAKGFAPIVAVQPMYNLLKRQVEVEILPLAAHEQLAVCPYSPIAAGLLTGKYHRGESGRIKENKMYIERYKDAAYMEVAGRFVEYAQAKGVSPAALANAWVISHPTITSAIVGARNLAQFDEALGCVDIRLTAEQRAEITALSIDPPLATDREPTEVAVSLLTGKSK